MNFLLAPGIALMYKMSNKGKMPVCSALYLAPLALLYWETGQHASSATRIAIVVMVSIAIYAMLCWYVQARDGFKALGGLLARLADGDLTSAKRTLLGGAFQNLFASITHVNGNLGGIVANVRESADSLARAAGEIAGSSAHLSQRTEQQAATLEQTASGMEELSRTVRQNAQNCEQASVLARNAENVARTGASAVHGVVEGMAKIDQSSKRIADIIGTMEGIAFQTNILALNAAVEAARAGESGRGFAVVASEVRALAQRSADAAREVRALIEQSVAEIRDGNRKAESAGKVIDEIVSSVQEASELIGRIAVASNEQSTGVGEVGKAIVQLDDMTQQNASLVQEGASAARALEAQADRMRELVSRFKIDDTAPTFVNFRNPAVARLASRSGG